MIKRNIAYNKKLEKKGVVFVDVDLSFIEEGAKIASGAVIYPLCYIDKNSELGANAIISQGTEIENSKIGDGVTLRGECRITGSEIQDGALIERSVIIESKVGNETTVGHFAYLSPNSIIGKGCRIGDYVEIKNSNIGNRTKVSHLTYVGDSDLGERINLGCGVVFVNYDGKEKFRSTVKDGAFIGCNANIISPITIDENAYVAAGSTVTKDVPSGALYIERTAPKIIEGFAKTKLKRG
jgi:bifunctional UDP-N-acetylglucosamine pyrophosphorylase/glucosamine-1-phosphate N-acetyltransferase